MRAKDVGKLVTVKVRGKRFFCELKRRAPPPRAQSPRLDLAGTGTLAASSVAMLYNQLCSATLTQTSRARASQGIVTRVNDVKPLMEFACYTCDDCGFEIYQARGAQPSNTPDRRSAAVRRSSRS